MRVASAAFVLALMLSAIVEDARAASSDQSAPASLSAANAAENGCLTCHAGIEEMHPGAHLSCVDCHGGDERATRKDEAHIASKKQQYGDERVAALDDDLAWRRFKNPMDLRVARATCGECHEKAVGRVEISLHATTAGHLSDGYYEMGLSKKRGARFGVFAARAPKDSRSEIAALIQLPPFDDSGPKTSIATHFTDLARKECSQCHLWSSGRAVRGRVGFDGDHRGEGCAACHVEYALDGLSKSNDPAISKVEPGHARMHRMTRAPTTQTCTSCHWGDAAIGLDFRGLAQLPPGAPGGPEIAGTTSQLLNRQFYLSDPAITPPDLHHERGMHCIDCHTQNDVMGDGQLHGHMEHAVEISCSDCHGTFDARSTLTSERGTKIENLTREGDRVVLTSKVTGKRHDVAQIAELLDPKSPTFNSRAAQAMTKEHAGLECYACHAGWNPNFLGFHFDRNASLTQLDLLSGKRTEGRVTTQEKVFATWKSFYAGRNEKGRIAPYLTGFSAFGSFVDERGERVLDQVMPVTSAGLSGITMIHHQVHTTRATTRSCVECHRAPETWGLGSQNFQLARQLAFVADRRGVEVVALDRQRLAAATPLAKLVQPGIVALAIDATTTQGFATTVFAAEEQRGVHAIDVRDPTAPKRLTFAATIDPHAVEWRAGLVFVADGAGGLRIFDAEKPGALPEVGRLVTCDARDVTVRWPFAYVADGNGGLWIIDVRVPSAPTFVGGAGLAPSTGAEAAIRGVDVLFQYSRPRARGDVATDRRTSARLLLAVIDEHEGLLLLDATEPKDPQRIAPALGQPGAFREDGWQHRAVALRTHVDLAQPQGSQRTQERDYAYVLSERVGDIAKESFLDIVDVSDPARATRVARLPVGFDSQTFAFASFYSAPFVASAILVPGAETVTITDVSISAQPSSLGALAGMWSTRAIAAEGFSFDRMLDERNRPLKDVSHEGSRWLTLPEIQRVLDVPFEKFGLEPGDRVVEPHSAATARREFEHNDRDGSGFLDVDEVSAALSSADRDEDARVSFAEWARAAGAKNVTPSTAMPEPVSGTKTRTGYDGDLSRLFDGLDPLTFDKDRDTALSRAELDKLYFTALDLDGSGALDRGEASRAPGRWRELRFGDARARALFASIDTNRDGDLRPTEVRAPDADWKALDANGDGLIALARPPGRPSVKGEEPRASEWPATRPYASLLPPTFKPEELLKRFDRDADGRLTRKELEKRLELFFDLDNDESGIVEASELAFHAQQLSDFGVGVTAESFRARWDFDGDGQVSETEVSIPAWLRSRVFPKTR